MKRSLQHRTQKEYDFGGFGFDVKLWNVPVMFFDGQWVPDINYDELERAVALALTFNPSALTGRQVHFMRRHLGLTLEEVAQKLGVTRQAASKWEAAGAAPTKMTYAAEKLFRLMVLDALGAPGKLFKQAYEQVIAPCTQLPRRAKAATPRPSINLRNPLTSLTQTLKQLQWA